ncbi:hypothetical protein [Segatella sp.]|jgi:hypothetical protein|uniref:hypothetical protein n=1 Tax=Segatella sp. TaxID=2974253 RepID=UPI003AAD2C22
MELLKLIFYKTYCWQRRFGYGIFDTIFALCGSLSVWLNALAILMVDLIGRENLPSINSDTLVFSLLTLHVSIPIILTIVLLPNRRYYIILLQMHRKYKNKYRWLALSFIIIPTLLLILGILPVIIRLSQT